VSTPRRHQRRDHLGRFASPTGGAGGRHPAPGAAVGPRRGPAAWAARLVAAGRLGQGGQGLARGARLALAALGGELARRLYRLAVVAVALAAAVVLLYEHSDSPAALMGTVRADSAARGAGAAQPSRTTSATTRPPAEPDGSAPRGTRPDGSAPRASGPAAPAGVAAGWYAARNHLEARQVRPLQQDKVSNREVRVLVMADRGNGRLDTALVTVRRDASGRWSVP
jgi:hypothetical protein